MKYTLKILILILLGMSFLNSTAKNSITITITKKYILLPIQDEKSESIITILYPNGQKSPKFWIRLAENKIDYWVKLDVKKYIGKEISLAIENTNGKDFGIKNIKQSDKFKFNCAEKYRPAYHFSPEYGWMNDPNGMVYFDGEYHLFYQYNPFGCVWGNMHWGHAVSKNLTDWKYLPVVLAPDSLGAIFSGSAVIDKENTAGFGKNAMVAIYTSAGNVQAQSIAYSTDKGRTFTKYEHNPVIKNQGIPDFRDPKVFWHKETSQWIMSLATKQTITFYGSKNLKDWSRLSEFGEGIGCHTGVWECPDLFPLNYEGKTKWILIVNINPGGPNGGSAGQYFIGNFNGKTFTAEPLPYPLWVDYGRDNYAGVTWNNIPETDGRRLLIGWMNNWDYANQIPTKYFRSSNTVPRELSLKNNGKHLVLANYPTKEVLPIFKKASTKPDFEVSKEFILKDFLKKNTGAYKIEMTIAVQNSTKFGFSLFNTKQEQLDFDFDTSKEKLSVNRDKSGLVDFNNKFTGIANAPFIKKKEYKVTLLVDKSSAELFINQGELAMTTLFFPSEAMNNLRFYSSEKISIKNLEISIK